jgi:RNA polymerase sigma factor (TIGR02999 family)
MSSATGEKWVVRMTASVAAEAMRCILVDNARRKKRLKRGGGRLQVGLAGQDLVAPDAPDDLLALDDCLTRLAEEDAAAARVAQLRFFTGLSVEEAGRSLGLSRAAAYRHWTYARAWLRCEISNR